MSRLELINDGMGDAGDANRLELGGTLRFLFFNCVRSLSSPSTSSDVFNYS